MENAPGADGNKNTTIASGNMPNVEAAMANLTGKKSSKMNKMMIATIVLAVLLLGAVGYIVVDKVTNNGVESTQIEEISQNKTEDTVNTEIVENTETGVEDTENTEVTNTVAIDSNSAINKRLYTVNSEMNKQRYYLLIDGLTYDMQQNHLNNDAYILDLDFSSGNQSVRKVDLAGVLKPVTDQYINDHKGSVSGVIKECTVEYFAPDTFYSVAIDYESEIPFKVYYRCIQDDGGEASLGSQNYAFNVNANTVREINGKVMQ